MDPKPARTLEGIITETAHAAFLKGIEEVSQLGTERKGDVGDIVTRADICTENFIVRRLKERFSSCTILSEERGGGVTEENFAHQKLLFIIDPLDGTTNHVCWAETGIAMPRSISIGAFCYGEALAGVVYDISTGTSYSAAKGNGVTIRNKSKTNVRTITRPLAPYRSLEESIVLTSWAYGDTPKGLMPGLERLAGRVASLRLLGSAALDLVYASIAGFPYFHNSLKPFDAGAGILFLEEMDIRATNWRGEPFGVWDEAIVAAPENVFDEFFELILPPRERREYSALYLCKG